MDKTFNPYPCRYGVLRFADGTFLLSSFTSFIEVHSNYEAFVSTMTIIYKIC